MANDSTEIAPIFVAAANGQVDEIVRLIDGGAPADTVDSKGNTPLMVAANNGRAEAVSALLKHSAKPNMRNYQGDTALMLAVAAGQAAAVPLLLDAGADLRAWNWWGESAESIACKNGQWELVELLQAARSKIAYGPKSRLGDMVVEEGNKLVPVPGAKCWFCEREEWGREQSSELELYAKRIDVPEKKRGWRKLTIVVPMCWRCNFRCVLRGLSTFLGCALGTAAVICAGVFLGTEARDFVLLSSAVCLTAGCLLATYPAVRLDRRARSRSTFAKKKYPVYQLFVRNGWSPFWAESLPSYAPGLAETGPVQAVAMAAPPGQPTTNRPAPISREAEPAGGKDSGPLDEKYVADCLAQRYEERPEARSWNSDPAFRKVLDPLNSGDSTAACREAEALVARFDSFADLYGWWGDALLRMGQLDKARSVLRDALGKTNQKFLLCNLLGKVEWKAQNLGQAVYWWAQGMHCQESLSATNYGDSDGAYLYLYYVAEALGLSECSKALLSRVDAIRPGKIRLDDSTADDLMRLTRLANNGHIKQVLNELNRRYLVPKMQEQDHKEEISYATGYVFDPTIGDYKQIKFPIQKSRV